MSAQYNLSLVKLPKKIEDALDLSKASMIEHFPHLSVYLFFDAEKLEESNFLPAAGFVNMVVKRDNEILGVKSSIPHIWFLTMQVHEGVFYAYVFAGHNCSINVEDFSVIETWENR